ncbi:MAG TPA: acyltransferase family protein [Flexivirga sp.]|uniref:acyltransferase family protein n=1 Tax=Flexivirga sp. TaxID=1962927 RepID=UPI002C3D244F|nr:acyltransferase family protein [Flexivirga sp.]HWC24452.1 acyltransferase family protein [Flexivirga sp.]
MASSPGDRAPVRTDIQALRALSVLLVVGYHLWPGRLTGGFIGVDVFFVISGFLITGQLAREADRTGRISLVTFWTRRAFRLLPAALLVIVLTTLAMFAWAGENVWRAGLQQALGSAFYVQNWVLSSTATDYLSSSDPPTAFQHFWSLSVEEQFYLVLPLLLVAVLAVSSRRTWRARFVVVLGAGTLASLAWSVHLTATNSAAAYFVTTTRAWEFGIGALLALLGQARLHKVPPAVAWVGLAGILVAAWEFTAGTAFPGYAAALPTVGGALVLATVRHDRVWNAVADSRPVQLIGDASYSIYLWHWPILTVAPWVAGHSLGFVPRAVILLGSIGIGWASTRFIEAPLQPHGAVTWRGRSGAVVIGGVVTALVIGTGGLGMVQHDAAQSRQRVAAVLAGADPCVGAPALGRSGCAVSAELTPDLASLPKDDGNRAKCWASQGDPSLHTCTLGATTGAKVHALAIGDSHNNSLIPAYAKAATELGWRIDVAGKAGCYLTTAEIPVVDRDRAACHSWRHRMLDRIVKDPGIDLVIVTRKESGDATSTPADRGHTEQGMETAWKRLTASGKRVIVLQDVPQAQQDTLDCVARSGAAGGKDCALRQSAAFPAYEAQERAARGMPGVTFVNVEDLYCRHGSCPPVIGGVPVFFNPGHVSKTFAATLGSELATKLRKTVD